jgi:hypothetical protein
MDGQVSLPQYAHPRLADLIFAFDRWLQRRNAVFEFTHDPLCVFRLQLCVAEQEVSLGDGTRLRPGDRTIKLHFWNEHIPTVPPCGASIGWARQMYRATEFSLREIAAFLARNPDLDDVAVLWANMSWGTADQSEQLSRVTQRLGFEVFPQAANVDTIERLRRLGENILVSLMVLAQNTPALRRDSLWRDRTAIFLSRRILDRVYGGGPATKGT